MTHTEKLRGISTTYTAPTVDALARAVTDGRRKLGIRADYNAVHNEMKRRTGRSSLSNRATSPAAKESVRNLTPDQVLAGAKAVLKNMSGLVVSQTEINRRYEICKTCPMHKPLPGCWSCGAGKIILALYNKVMGKMYGQQRYLIPDEAKKHNCGVCRCYLSTLLPARLEDFHADTPEMAAKRPSNCWLKTENRKLSA